MRILVLSDKTLSRRLGDGLRVYGLFKYLTNAHQFHLVSFCRDEDERDPEVAQLFASTTMVAAPPPRRSSWSRRFYKAMSGTDFKHTSLPMQSAIAKVIAETCPDLLLDIGASAIPNLPTGPLPAPLVVDSIDEPLLREMRALRQGSLADRAAHLYQCWRFWNYERDALGRAALNIYVSEVDAEVYRRFFPDRAVAVVPNGVDIEYFSPLPQPMDPRYVVFEGNMHFGPNVDAAQRLVRNILPAMKERLPDVRVGLVGRDPVDEVRALASPDVEVTGTVDDVRPYLARAAVFVCPLQLGSGIKNKILQAWAMGRPVVATPQCLGGLTAKDGHNILVRSEPRAFADAVCELLQDPERAAALGAAGRETVVREYSWQNQATRFESLLRSAVDECPRSTQGVASVPRVPS
jgi:glycosyltransferase involved in cell wall biosynthesis